MGDDEDDALFEQAQSDFEPGEKIDWAEAGGVWPDAGPAWDAFVTRRGIDVGDGRWMLRVTIDRTRRLLMNCPGCQPLGEHMRLDRGCGCYVWVPESVEWTEF